MSSRPGDRTGIAFMTATIDDSEERCQTTHRVGEGDRVTEPIVLATCAAWPDLSVSDRYLADALAARGRAVKAAPRNGPFDPFARAAVAPTEVDALSAVMGQLGLAEAVVKPPVGASGFGVERVRRG